MIIDLAMQNSLESGNVSPRWILLIWARNRSSGAVERIAFWTGDDVRNFDIESVLWTAYAGAFLDLSAPEFGAGLDIRTQRVTLFSDAPETIQAARIYDLRLCRAELHLGLMDPGGVSTLGTTDVFRGFIESAPISEDGGSATMELSMVSQVAEGTGRAGLKKSDASQRARLSTDTGRAYADIAAKIPVIWGAKRKGSFVIRKPGGDRKRRR